MAIAGLANVRQEENDAWLSFKSKFNKKYEPAEEEMRRAIFLTNLQIIESHNLKFAMGEVSFSMAVNDFSDLTDLEFHQFYLSPVKFDLNASSLQETPLRMATLDDGKLPTTVDWRTKGYVTPVKNQKQCGSCWAFSTTGVIEGQYFKKHRKLISLSEQQLVDCSRDFRNMGCRGGLPSNAYDYIKSAGGIELERDYPYYARDMQCKFNKMRVAAKVKGGRRVLPHEYSLQDAVAKVGPISVGIDASQPSFRHYSGTTIYDEPNCTQNLDHAVLVVGYGTENGRDYWLVKNSWGPSWGLNGYIKMSRNKNNQCGIATMATYPIVA